MKYLLLLLMGCASVPAQELPSNTPAFGKQYNEILHVTRIRPATKWVARKWDGCLSNGQSLYIRKNWDQGLEVWVDGKLHYLVPVGAVWIRLGTLPKYLNMYDWGEYILDNTTMFKTKHHTVRTPGNISYTWSETVYTTLDCKRYRR